MSAIANTKSEGIFGSIVRRVDPEHVPGEARFTCMTHCALNSLYQADKLRSCKLVPSNFPTLLTDQAQESVALNQEDNNDWDQWFRQFNTAGVLNPSTDGTVGCYCPSTPENTTQFTREDNDASRLARRTMVRKPSLPLQQSIEISPNWTSWYKGYTHTERVRVILSGSLIEFDLVANDGMEEGRQQEEFTIVNPESSIGDIINATPAHKNAQNKYHVSNITKELLDMVIQDQQNEDAPDYGDMWSSQEQNKKVNVFCKYRIVCV